MDQCGEVGVCGGDGGLGVGEDDDAEGSLIILFALLPSSSPLHFILGYRFRHSSGRISCSKCFEMAGQAVDTDENVLAYLRRRRRSFGYGKIILKFLALSFSLLAFGGMDVCSTIVAQW